MEGESESPPKWGKLLMGGHRATVVASTSETHVMILPRRVSLHHMLRQLRYHHIDGCSDITLREEARVSD